MEKMGLLKTEKMGEYEKEQGRASYLTNDENKKELIETDKQIGIMLHDID